MQVVSSLSSTRPAGVLRLTWRDTNQVYRTEPTMGAKYIFGACRAAQRTSIQSSCKKVPESGFRQVVLARLHNARMANIDSVLKTEIARLARKQIRAELEPLKKAASQQRSHIAALRGEIEALERALKVAAKRGTSGGAQGDGAESAGDQHALRFRAAGLASHRKRLGLSAADFGKLLGVSSQSVYKWETGEVRPRRSQLESIAGIRKLGRREALARLNTPE